LFQAPAWSSDRDTTSFGIAFILVEKSSSRPGQIRQNICQVRRPSSSAPVSSSAPRRNGSPVTASGPNRKAQPPGPKPSFPSGSCVTPSRVTNSITMTRLITASFVGGFLQDERARPQRTGSGTAMIAWLAVMNTAVAFTLWNFSLRQLTAGTSSVVNNAMLPQIGLLGWLVLGEAPGPWQWAGMILVLAGLAVAVSGRGEVDSQDGARGEDGDLV
jgi:multidrug transporter EmrE-like cation transporter